MDAHEVSNVKQRYWRKALMVLTGILIGAMISTALLGCGGPPSIAGTYKTSDGVYTLQLNDDASCSVTINKSGKTQTNTGHYKVEGDTITITPSNGDANEVGKVSDKKIEFPKNGLVFTKS